MNKRGLIVLLLAFVLAALTLGGYAFNHTQRSSAAQQISATASQPPPRGVAPSGTVRFIALGDMGTGDENQLALARRMTSYRDERPYDTVLMLGDNIYANGDPADLPKKFEQPYAELLRQGVRFYAVLGNHDVNKGRTAEINYKPFNMGGRAYYSFTKGNDLIEFFALDSTAMDETQLQWLDAALAASKARWMVAYFHHPIYSSGKKHGSNTKLRKLFEPLFVRYKVAAVFSGHDHVYERTKPQQGVQYFVSGAGGQLRRGDIDRGSQYFAAGNDDVNSFMYVEVTRDRLAFWAVDAAGNILDRGVLSPLPVAAP